MAKKVKKNSVKQIVFEQLLECNSCGDLYSYTTRNRATTTTCRRCISFIKRTETKKRALQFKGGQCFNCGYNRCDAALHFHHFLGTVDGFFTEEEKFKYKKSFSISNRPDMNFDKLKNELEKCILLCGNCHSELHAGLWLLKKEELNL